MDQLVLDTNQIVETDWYLRSAAIRLVEKAVHLGLISIVVPEIVFEEACNKFRHKLHKHLKGAHDLNTKISKLIDSEFETPTLRIEDACKKYAEYLDARLKELKASLPAYGGIDHKWLLAKAFGPRRPFHEGDRGYRDSLVWYAVVHDVASPKHQTYFVSANKKDFGDQKDGLHPDLIVDLKEAGIEGHVTHMHDLQVFVDNVIKPTLEKVPSPLTVEKFGELFEANLDSIIAELSGAIEKQGLPGLPSELFESSPYIEQLGLVSVELGEAYKLDDTSYYTSFEVEVEASFDQTVFGPDAIWIADTWGMSITGGDEKLTDLSFTLTIPLTIVVVTNTAHDVEYEFSVELQDFYGFCRHCGTPVITDAAEACSACGQPLF